MASEALPQSGDPFLNCISVLGDGPAFKRTVAREQPNRMLGIGLINADKGGVRMRVHRHLSRK
jgi:hypothetical protein